MSNRCIEYGIRRPSVGAGFRCSYQRERRRLFKTARGRRRFSQKTTEKPRFQAQQRDRTHLEFSFGGVMIPADTKRLYVTATLAPSTGDPRIQPTGFPDIGPVFYPDPSGEHGQICLIESEASMANRLEEVCVADRYTGTLAPELAGLPYIRVTAGDRFMTASTLDGHRFASEYIMKAKGQFPKGPRTNGEIQSEMLVDYVKRELMERRTMFPLPMCHVSSALRWSWTHSRSFHGFQISLKNLLTFVGLRSPRGRHCLHRRPQCPARGGSGCPHRPRSELATPVKRSSARNGSSPRRSRPTLPSTWDCSLASPSGWNHRR